uniref:Uncharacterized protein LOC114325737 n=1 Tax=Diabrotica virgifera virgifera TaxID=50390 RepID=A0A6P7F477_DIAVI
MSKTILILVFVSCFVAHIQCRIFIDCLDPDNPGYLQFDKQIIASFPMSISVHFPATGYQPDSDYSCLKINCDKDTTVTLIDGGVGFRYANIKVDFKSWQTLTCGIQIYTLQPEVSSV